MLVQYLLKVNCTSPHFAAIQTGAGFIAADMIVNGIWDQYWAGYLGNYLRTIARKGRPVLEAAVLIRWSVATPRGRFITCSTPSCI